MADTDKKKNSLLLFFFKIDDTIIVVPQPASMKTEGCEKIIATMPAPAYKNRFFIPGLLDICLIVRNMRNMEIRTSLAYCFTSEAK